MLSGEAVKALTISQPFASLIADGKKWVENRNWATRYRGPLAIHAGKGTQYMTRKELAEVPHGCIVAVASLVGCVNLASARKWAEDREHWGGSTLGEGTQLTVRDLLAHEHAEGPWCWILEDVQKLESPVAVAGAQGLWVWDERLVSSR